MSRAFSNHIAFRRLMLTLACAVLLLGCQNRSDGPTRYPVTGNVTYDGQPVPKGFVTLEPDAAASNSGPGGGGPIVNGRYSTGAEAGVVGGPHTIRIIGYDGIPTSMEGEKLPDGKSLFPPYQATFDFPKQASEKNFEIPKAGP